jgi:hypothetical protein
VVLEDGVNTTEILHVAPAAREVPQVVVSVNALAPVPVMVMPVIAKLALPGLESCATNADAEEPTVVLGKDKLAGLRIACGLAGATPVPVSAAV